MDARRPYHCPIFFYWRKCCRVFILFFSPHQEQKYHPWRHSATNEICDCCTALIFPFLFECFKSPGRRGMKNNFEIWQKCISDLHKAKSKWSLNLLKSPQLRKDVVALQNVVIFHQDLITHLFSLMYGEIYSARLDHNDSPKVRRRRNCVLFVQRQKKYEPPAKGLKPWHK